MLMLMLRSFFNELSVMSLLRHTTLKVNLPFLASLILLFVGSSIEWLGSILACGTNGMEA